MSRVKNKKMSSPSMPFSAMSGEAINAISGGATEVAGGRSGRRSRKDKLCDNKKGWRMSRAKKGEPHYRMCVRRNGSHKSYLSRRRSPRAYRRKHWSHKRIHSSVFRGGNEATAE